MTAIRERTARTLLRLRTPCTTFPCKRCDKAGRTSWRSREAWHAKRRNRALLVVAWVAATLLAWVAVIWFVIYT